MNLALPLNFLTQFGCGFVLFSSFYPFFNFLGMVLMLGFCFKILHFGWRFKGTLRFLCDFGGIPRIRLCLDNMVWELSKPKIPSLANGSDPNGSLANGSDPNTIKDKRSNVSGSSEDGSENNDSEFDIRDEDDVFDVKTLRRLIKIERKKANAAFAELDKERIAASSSADEAMSMILRLQSEKSSAEIEANQFRRMAEQKLEYDEEVIESLQWTITRHESHRSVLEEQLGVYREELKHYIGEDGINQVEADLSRDRNFENETVDDSVVSSSETGSQTLGAVAEPEIFGSLDKID